MENSNTVPTPENWSSGDVQTSNVRLHYTRTGGNKPPLVLAHGFSDDGLCWTPVAQELEDKFDVVMVDARGHGFSEAPEEGYNSQQMAHDLAEVISSLKLESPVILGHSMGAATTLNLAGLYPQVPRAILLEDPPAWWKTPPTAASDSQNDEEQQKSREWLQRTRAWLLELQTKSREELIESQRSAAPSWSQTEVELWADAHKRLSLNVANGPGIRGKWDVNLLKNVVCPTLLITADKERGAIVSEDDAQALKALVPQTKIAHIAGAGHSIHREQFESFMDAVRAFLRDVVISS